MAGAMATVYLHLAEMQTELVKSLNRRQVGELEIEASAGNTTRCTGPACLKKFRRGGPYELTE